MNIKTRHTGLVVRDIVLSIKFYESLGFQLWKREVEKGDFISSVVGLSNAVVETAKLKASDGSLIELLEYRSHPQTSSKINSPSNSLGCSHIAFTVEDIENACSKIIDSGGSCVNSPSKSPSGEVLVAYCHDIDGILMELVEEIK